MAYSKKYFWLKLKEDFFNQKEIKKLRKIAGGDTFTIIYLKMQLLSLRNDGILKYEGTEENLSEQLSLEIDEDPDNIQVTLNFLKANKLIESSNDYEFLLTKASECIGKEGASAERVRKFRERKQLQTHEEEKALLCNTTVTKCNTEIEIEKEIEKEIDIDNTTKVVSSNKLQPVIDAWNNLKLQKLVSIRPGTNRYKLLNARIKEYGMDNVIKAINNIEDSAFLRGDNHNNWVITFDWLIKPNCFIKVLEGNYRDKEVNNVGTGIAKQNIRSYNVKKKEYKPKSTEEIDRECEELGLL